MTGSHSRAPVNTQSRKEDHLRIPLERDVQSIPSPWDAVRMRHEALPSRDLAEIDLSSSFLGQALKAPILITGMTGGAAMAKEINERLAAAAAHHGIAMGVGSQRAALEDDSLVDTYRVILDHDVPVRLANVGMPQLVLWGEDAAGKCEQAVEMVDAHGLAIHLNTVQEACQPEGDTIAKGGLEAIAAVCRDLRVPVVVKETGAGMDGQTAKRLVEAGAAAIDVGGLGGTSFAAVEHHRASDQGLHVKAEVGRAFWGWGIPTPEAVASVRSQVNVPIVATGGLRNGLDAARAISLGADLGGFAGTMFRAAAKDAAIEEMQAIVDGLAVACFLSDVASPSGLPTTLVQS